MTTDTIGGVWTFSLELCRALREFGVTVTLAALGAGASAEQVEAVAQAGNTGLREGSFRLEWMDDSDGDVRAAGEWLLELEDEVKPDVIHLNDYSSGALTFGAPVVVVGHSCVCSWWSAVRGEAAPRRYDAYRDRVRRGLARADVVAAPTRAMAKELNRWYGPLGQVEVVYNGCDPQRFAPAIKRPFVLAAGRLWDEAKNLAALTEIVEQIDWPIQVAGPTMHPETGQQARPSSSLGYLGQLSADAMAAQFACAGIYAHTALYEPFGLSVLEAAMSGCALVLSDIPSLRELWRDTATYVDPRDPSGLKRAIECLIDDASAREEFGRIARRRARRFTPRRCAQAYYDMYRALAPSRRSVLAAVAQGVGR